ncbi:MAG: endonuclease III domain-containing protein [Candidatus Omnitrophica bacterium]|nr:endonuclease III domain-containing protein [Candidatus Omnitrophota bacterium]MBU1128619.1 endonuclease III domain-containing protein [Candidatus Omnitrophota bacterium]MBU1784365.1 endonuclease III domain-containing protein [Candidatus Omnitrophota bacterium]MBU1852168.1 endonuclease III domain-containing protein [Candidatus Omnitrophota bacterium]
MGKWRVMNKGMVLHRMHELLEGHFGDLGWWPADTPFEMIIGAVLTQNTAWRNVETAIKNLKECGLMDIEKIEREEPSHLAAVIRSSGYHRVKSAKLQELSRYLIAECGGDLKKMEARDMKDLRCGLLGVKGVGPETADSILLYAFGKPVFVASAYAKRVFSRHRLIDEDSPYDLVQTFVHENFDGTTKRFNQLHAFLVETGKKFCKKKRALCGECPLGGLARGPKERNHHGHC